MDSHENASVGQKENIPGNSQALRENVTEKDEECVSVIESSSN